MATYDSLPKKDVGLFISIRRLSDNAQDRVIRNG